jgi:hypothetical protein
MFEDNRVNIMTESLNTFEEIVKNPIFKNTPTYVFLNKKDIFEEVIDTHPLKKYFPEFEGGPGRDSGIDFIKQKFRDILREHVPSKALQFCVVSACDRSDVKSAFLDVKNTLKRMVRFKLSR